MDVPLLLLRKLWKEFVFHEGLRYHSAFFHSFFLLQVSQKQPSLGRTLLSFFYSLFLTVRFPGRCWSLMCRHGWFYFILFYFYFGINRIDMQTCTKRMGTQQLFLWAIPNVCYCENKFAIETMRTLTMKLFLSVFHPISGYCKQECPEHAWPATHCGRNFGLSSASGLRSDARSADARSPFSAGCAALCVHARFHVWEPGLTTCAHTPKENSTSTKRLESYKKEALLTF